MEAAAKNLASVTLELGGKSPTIVGPGADLKRAADWVTFGKFANAGQTCIAPDHLFVHESVKDGFLAALRARIAKAYGKDPLASPHLAGIVNAHHAGRLGHLVDDATAKGAKIIGGGERQGTRMAPTLMEAVTPDMEIDREEIFGPVLPVIAYADIDEVIAPHQRQAEAAGALRLRPRPGVRRKDRRRDVLGRRRRQPDRDALHPSRPALRRRQQFGHRRGARRARLPRLQPRAGDHGKPLLLAADDVPPYTAGVKRLVGMARKLLG